MQRAFLHLLPQVKETGTLRSLHDNLNVVVRSKVGQDPLNLIRGHCLKIVDKQGRVVPLAPSYTQLRLLHVILTLWKRQQRVRLHVLKARQVYISTIVEALFFALASQTANFKAAVIADDDKGSEYLFGMQRRFQEQLLKDYPYLVTRTRRNRSQLLEWETKQSWVMTDTARNLRAGRKFTLDAVHLSESAFFVDYDTLTTGLFQSVPDEPHTIIIDESTANGMAGGFYDGVMRCYTPEGKWDSELQCWVGKDGWILLFIAWYEHPAYRKPLFMNQLVDLEGIHFASLQERDEFLRNEETLRVTIMTYHLQMKQFKGTMEDLRHHVDEQLNWRRAKIKEDCKGDLKVFDQEYPDSVDTAFIASGKPALNIAVITRNLKLAKYSRPKFIGNFEWANVWKDEAGTLRKGPKILNGSCLNFDKLRVKWVENPQGYWKRWRDPEPGWSNRYCMGVDVAEGLDQGDYDSARLMDRVLRQDGAQRYVDVIATFLGHLDTDIYSDELIKAAIYYDHAVIGIERNNHGLTVIKTVFQVYRQLYWQQDFTKGYATNTENVGWRTDVATKPQMVDDLNEWLRTGKLRDPDLDFWVQARTFVKDKRGKIGAQNKATDPGTHAFDDAVMAEAVMLQTHLWMSPPTKIAPAPSGWLKRIQDKKPGGGANSV